ncbi:MAG: NAD-dependent epimerase/dehydratase family protein [Bacteroidia bacterium]|nr:NAD-dependent epimerase/dehydratase family protein [Bacteroidia bacterium]MCF8425749.1 NAD-dependent epimerase/dehydratase family protein [Bacteroidia bacterium]MCF8447036.1 NAD-dependent epimerase/dehydratase family protein [Bacteroidia bacterium]
MNKQILITGGAGFVGSTLAIGLKTKYPNYTIIALDNLRRSGSELNLSRLKDAEVSFVHGDIRNPEDLESFTNLDFIIDASADPSVLSGINSPVMPLINSNLNGTVNCLELAQRTGAAFIFLSTSRIYPIKNLEAAAFEELETRFVWTDKQSIRGISSKGVTEEFPLEGSRSFYGTTKLASELLITEYNELKGLKTIINRCGVISGPWQMGKVDQGVLVLWLARHYFKKELAYIGYGGTGKQMRDVMHSLDLLDLIDHQIHNLDTYNNQTLNVGGGLDTSFSLLELTDLCQEITGNKISINPITENRTADVRIYVSDCAKLNQVNGGSWKPTRNVKTLVSDTFTWLQTNEKNLKNILN